MSEAVLKLNQLVHNVARRKNLLRLQDALVLAFAIGAVAAALLVVYVKWRVLQTPLWLVVIAVFVMTFAALLVRWWMKRTDETEASFAIDDALQLEDRFTTARTLITEKPSRNLVEDALIVDAAENIGDAQADAIVPYRLKKFYWTGAIGAAALIAAFMIPQKALPGTAELLEVRAEIQAAGEELEKSSTEIEKFAPPDSVTAQLAKEQAELGRSFKRSSDTRAEALKKLGIIEERIRQRHEELKETRADEIVALAEKRLGSAINKIGDKDGKPADEKEVASDKADSKEELKAAKQKSNLKGAEKSKASASEIAKAKQSDTQKSDAKQQSKTAEKQNPQSDKGQEKRLAENQPEKSADSKSEKAEDQQDADRAGGLQKQNESEKAKSENKQIAETKNRAGENAGEQGDKQAVGKQSANNDANNKGANKDGKADNPGDLQAGKQTDNPSGEQQESQTKGDEQGKGEANKDAANPLTTLAAEQTAKVMPQLSDELMKKAADLRNGKISPEEIAKMAQSAAQLAKDLAPLAQSKEFQKTLEEMAKNVNWQQLEQVARELAKNEKLKQELKAAAKLLMQNQQIKETIAGFKKMGDEMAARERERRGETDLQNLKKQNDAANQSEQITLGGKNDAQGQRGGKGTSTQTARNDATRRLEGQGKETKLSGKLTNKPGGEYIYSGTKPGAGALRVPYSSAYPQYRRQAERTVERSQVPSQMRSMVRNYFDAINPDAKKN